MGNTSCVAVLVATLAGCGSSGAPSEDKHPDKARDPGETYAVPAGGPVGSVTRNFFCEWDPSPPSHEKVVVDLMLQLHDRKAQQTSEELQIIQQTGGRILHRFNVALVRVELDTSALRRLVHGPDRIATSAYGVTDPANYDVAVQVSYTRAVTDTDETALLGLGARNVARAATRILYSRLPDAIIPQVARLPGVDSVQASVVVCDKDL